MVQVGRSAALLSSNAVQCGSRGWPMQGKASNGCIPVRVRHVPLVCCSGRAWASFVSPHSPMGTQRDGRPSSILILLISREARSELSECPSKFLVDAGSDWSSLEGQNKLPNHKLEEGDASYSKPVLPYQAMLCDNTEFA